MKGKLHYLMPLALALMSCGNHGENYERRTIPGVNAPGETTTNTPTPGGAATPAPTGTNTDVKTVPPAPDPNAPVKLSFAKDALPILKVSCIGAGCHSTAAKADGVDVESLAGAKAAYTKSIATIKANTMPPAGPYPKVKPADVTKLEKWAADGFQQ